MITTISTRTRFSTHHYSHLNTTSQKIAACLILCNLKKIEPVFIIFCTSYTKCPGFYKHASLSTSPNVYLPYFAFYHDSGNDAFSRCCHANKHVANIGSSFFKLQNIKQRRQFFWTRCSLAEHGLKLLHGRPASQ